MYNTSTDQTTASRNSLKNDCLFYILDEFYLEQQIVPSPFNGDGEILNVYNITVNTSNFNLLSQIGENQTDYLRTLDPDDVLLPYRLSQNTDNPAVNNMANSLNYLTIAKNENAIEYENPGSGTQLVATNIPNILETQGNTPTLTLKNSNTTTDCKLMLGNVFTSNPDCCGNYAAIGGEHDNSKDYGKLNFYVRDLSNGDYRYCLLYTSPSPRDRTRARMPSSA